MFTHLLVLVGLGVAAVGYAYGWDYLRRHGWLASLLRRRVVRRGQPWCFMAGLAVLSVALLSPIDSLAHSLFLMHMLQHLLLIMVAPPLLLWGSPAPLVRMALLETRLKGVLGRLSDPFVAFALFYGTLYLWHVPALYDLALRDEWVHALEHASFFYGALLFWWRIFDPTRGWFAFWPWPPAKWVYLLVAAPPSYLLGSILWASGGLLYSYYAGAPRLWGLSPLEDQQYGGLLMWLHAWMYFMASMIVFYLWYDPETEMA